MKYLFLRSLSPGKHDMIYFLDLVPGLCWIIWSVLGKNETPGKCYLFSRNMMLLEKYNGFSVRKLWYSLEKFGIWLCFSQLSSWIFRADCLLENCTCFSLKYAPGFLEQMPCRQPLDFTWVFWRESVLDLSVKFTLLEKKNRYFKKIRRRLLLPSEIFIFASGE